MLRTIVIAFLVLISCSIIAPLHAQDNSAIDAVNFYFPANAYKFKVSSDIKSYVKELKEFINENEGYTVKLDGYAHDGTNDAWNTRVSKYRVRAVRDLLVEYGISNDKIEIEYFGKTRPISEGDSSSELAKNRRVELRVQQEG